MISVASHTRRVFLVVIVGTFVQFSSNRQNRDAQTGNCFLRRDGLFLKIDTQAVFKPFTINTSG